MPHRDGNHDAWLADLAKKSKFIIRSGNMRIRVEFLEYAIDDSGKILGYFIPSMKMGIVYDKPRDMDPLIKWKKEDQWHTQ